MPSSAPQPGNRSLVIVLLVVLGLLVLICSGVIAFQWRKSNDSNSAMPSQKAAISVLRSEDGRDGPLGAPYRQVERVVYPGGVTR